MDTPDENVQSALWRSRWYSAAKRGMLGALAGAALSAAVAFLFLALGIGPWGVGPVVAVVPLLAFAGIVWGARRPRAYTDAGKPNPMEIAGLVFLVLPIALCLAACVWAMSVFAVGTAGDSFDCSAEVFDVAATGRAGRFVEKYVPAGAKDFRCKGYAGRGGRVRFSCEVGESNFLAHAAANGVELRRDDPTFSADPATAEWCRGKRFMSDGTPFLDHLTDGTRPERFWYHDRRFENGGGWTVLYDIDRGVLYGHYSAN